MLHRSNFDLYAPQHNGQLTRTRDGDTDDDVSQMLFDDAPKVNLVYNPDLETGNGFFFSAHPNNTGEFANGSQTEFYLGYKLQFQERTQVNCFYIEQLSIVGAKVVIVGSNGQSIAAGSQVEDFIHIDIPRGTNETVYDVRIQFPIRENLGSDFLARFSSSAPFFGGQEISHDSGTCYSWGRGYQASAGPSRENTNGQNFFDAQASFASKSITIQDANSESANKMFDFLNSVRGRTSLLIENSRKSKHNFILGSVSQGASSSQARGDLNTIQLTATAKYST